MIRIGFELETDEGVEAPSPYELAEALSQALPKEWWASSRCDSWGVKVLHPVTERGEALAVQRALDEKDKKIKKLEAVLAQEQKLTAHLEGQVENLTEKNDNQRKIIDQLQSDVKLVSETVDAQADRYVALQYKHGEQVKIIEDLQATVAGWKRKFNDRDTTVVKRNGHIDRLEKKIRELEATLAQNQALVREHGEQVNSLRKKIRVQKDTISYLNVRLDEARKLAAGRKSTIGVMDKIIFEKEQKLMAAYAEVDELRDRGFTMSDETLTRLEDMAGHAYRFADDARDQLFDLQAVLDEVRTERPA